MCVTGITVSRETVRGYAYTVCVNSSRVMSFLGGKPTLYYEKVASDAETESEPLAACPEARPSAALREAHAQIKVLICCSAYALVGPTLVLVNAHILNKLNFPYPLLLSALGQFVTSVYCACVIHVLPRLQHLWRTFVQPLLAQRAGLCSAEPASADI